jgi:hypothetical protein
MGKAEGEWSPSPMKYAPLDSILEELARDGKIRIEEENITRNAH